MKNFVLLLVGIAIGFIGWATYSEISKNAEVSNQNPYSYGAVCYDTFDTFEMKMGDIVCDLSWYMDLRKCKNCEIRVILENREVRESLIYFKFAEPYEHIRLFFPYDTLNLEQAIIKEMAKRDIRVVPERNDQ